MTGPEVRRFAVPDTRAVVALLRAAGRWDALAALRGPMPDGRDPRTAGFVALDEDRIVGYGCWLRQDAVAPRADLTIVVDQGCRRQGLGVALLTQVRRDARRNGVSRLQLRFVAEPEIVRDVARGSVPYQGRMDGRTIVFTDRVEAVPPARDRAGLRWAASRRPRLTLAGAGGG